jgi:alpha-D-ribose 1-methylphosphonate 5-triphosphate synthase subunit PhnH
MELVSEAVEAPVPTDPRVLVGEACAAVVWMSDASVLDKAGVQKHIHLHSSAPSEKPNDLLDDELELVGSDSLGEAAYAGSGVSSLLVCDESEPSDAAVDVEYPGELQEVAYALQLHDEEGSEDAKRVSRFPAGVCCVVSADELLLGNA